MDAKPKPPATVADLIGHLDTRAGSLIITVFGDSVVPRGGSIWLGSLIRLMAPFGVSERLVRTGVYRLSREGWLASRSHGRKAFYHLTASGVATFAEADRRIYATEPPGWDGTWTALHILSALAAPKREALKSRLEWSGYGRLAPDLYIHTGERPVADLAGSDEVIAFHGRLSPHMPAADPRQVVERAWDLDRLNAAYAAFATSFAPFDRPLADPEEAFTLSSLMIHEYRRILLRDPQLPGELLPPGWAGHAARALAARLYRRHAEAAGCFVSSHMVTWQGAAPAPAPSYFDRFMPTAPASATRSPAL